MSPRAFALIALGGILVACASTEQYQSNVGAPQTGAIAGLNPSVGKAKICVVRRAGFLGAAIPITITDSGRPVGRIGPGGKLIWEREPGEVVIGASASNESNITITAKAGQVYFLETRSNWGAGFNTAACEIRLLSQAEGILILNKLN
jgi:hypothetical protein